MIEAFSVSILDQESVASARTYQSSSEWTIGRITCIDLWIARSDANRFASYQFRSLETDTRTLISEHIRSTCVAVCFFHTNVRESCSSPWLFPQRSHFHSDAFFSIQLASLAPAGSYFFHSTHSPWDSLSKCVRWSFSFNILEESISEEHHDHFFHTSFRILCTAIGNIPRCPSSSFHVLLHWRLSDYFYSIVGQCSTSANCDAGRTIEHSIKRQSMATADQKMCSFRTSDYTDSGSRRLHGKSREDRRRTASVSTGNDFSNYICLAKLV